MVLYLFLLLTSLAFSVASAQSTPYIGSTTTAADAPTKTGQVVFQPAANNATVAINNVKDDKCQDIAPRTVQCTQSQTGATISSRPPANSSNTDCHFRFQFNPDTQTGTNCPNIKAEYSSNSTQSPKFAFRVALTALVEFNDTIGIESSTSIFPLFLGNWTNPVLSITPNGNSSNYYRYETNCSDPNSQLVVSLDTTVVTDLAEANSTFRPNSIKYGIKIQNFPYKYANGKLSIVQLLISPASTQQVLDSDNNTMIGSTGYFSWTKSVSNSVWENVPLTLTRYTMANFTSTAAYVMSKIAQTVLGNETFTINVFKIQQPRMDFIYWDPELVLSSNSSSYQDPSSSITNSGFARVAPVAPVGIIASIALAFAYF